MKKLEIILLLVTIMSFAGCENETAGTKTDSIMVYAAASLTDVISEISDSFFVDYHIKVQLNLASSGTLARQIEQGERPAIYLSASKNWADYIESSGYTLANYKKEIVQNDLVLIVPNSSAINSVKINPKTPISLLLNDGRLSMGNPAHVPAGKYAQEAIDFYDWNEQTRKKILPAKDVRSALMVVELSESPLGVVYRTDAVKSDKVKIVGVFDKESHKPIQYIASVITESLASKEFFNYLTSDKMKSVWSKYGFVE